MNVYEAACEYLDRGFSVIPVKKDDKKPYVSWTQFQKRLPTEQELYDWWVKWPNANVAIITGKISGIFVVDGDGEIGSRWIAENLPKTTIYVKTGRDKGIHAYYQIPDNEIVMTKTGWKEKVDVRGEGGYVVAPPSVHASGRNYELVIMEGSEGFKELFQFNPYRMDRRGNLADIDFSQVKTMEEIEEDKKSRLLPTKEGNRNANLASAIGLYLQQGIEEENAWQMALALNSQFQPPLEMKEVKTTFRSILKKHKANNPELAITQVESAEMQAQQQERIKELIEKKIIERPTDTFPVECLQPGGLLQEIMEYTERSSAVHKPIFALGGAIALIGHLCGQRVMTETGLRTNMYCVSIGYSGTGKNAPHSAITQLLLASEARTSIGPSDTASGVALLRWLGTDNKNCSLVMFDEIGMLMRAGAKNPNSPMAELPRILTRLFSSTDRPEGKAYADEKNKLYLAWHHLSLYGSSTPMEFWGSLTEADTLSGFIARMLIFQALDDPQKARRNINAEIPKDTVEKINSIWRISAPIDEKRGNLLRVPIPFVVARTEAADKLLEEWSDQYFQKAIEFKTDSSKNAIFNRAAEHAAKLALIHCASLCGGNVVHTKVDVSSMFWACKVIDHCINVLIHNIERNISSNDFHAEQQKVIRILEQSPGYETTQREISKRLHLPINTLKVIFDSLIQNEQILILDILKPSGQKSTIVKLIEAN